jgi:hypothetical protein
MAIDNSVEDVFPLSEGPSRVGKSYHSLYRYVKGVAVKTDGGDSVLVKLETIKLTSGLATSMEAWHRFIKDLNAAIG